MDAAARSRIADPSLAVTGEQRIQWVARHSPVLNRLARTRLADGALRGRRVAVVVHLEAKTAHLALLLAEDELVALESGAPIATSKISSHRVVSSPTDRPR